MSAATGQLSQSLLTFTLADVVPERAHPGEGVVYVIEFCTGRVKVGQSNRPAKRVRALTDGAEFHQRKATRVWISPSHKAPGATERSLLAFARLMGAQVVGREYFDGVDFDFVVRHGCRLLGLAGMDVYQLVQPSDAVPAPKWIDPFAELRKHLLFASAAPIPDQRAVDLLDCDLRTLVTHEQAGEFLESIGHKASTA